MVRKLLFLGVLASAFACSQSTGADPDAGSTDPGADGGTTPDPDSGVEPDAGDPPDSGGEPDSGVMRDGGMHHDGGVDAGPPSFLYIVADDLDMKAFQYMPKVKALIGDQGMRFDNYFPTYSVCGPSRSTVLTGKYPHNHQVMDNYYPVGGYRRFVEAGNETQTVNVWLKSHGYQTALIGKYINGYPDPAAPLHVPPGWSDWEVFIGGVAYYNYKFIENGVSVAYGSSAAEYSTDVIARKTVAFIKANKGKPFFAYVAPFAPHGPATPAPRHASLVPSVDYPKTPAFNEPDTSDKPAWLRAYPSLTAPQIASIDDHFRNRIRSIQAEEDLVEAVLNALQATGDLDNTYVIFTADNGYHLGDHRLPGGKRTAYQEDTRLPFMIRGPQIPRGSSRSQWILNNDIAATVADLARVPHPQTDGTSLRPLLGARAAPADWRTDFYQVQRYSSVDMDIPDIDALHSGKWTYIESAVSGRELYDNVADPYQLVNLYPTADTALLATLKARMTALKACAGTTCR